MLNIFNFLILFGAFQGILIGVKLLFLDDKNKSSKKWLAAMMLSLAFILIRVSVIDVLNVQGQIPHFNFIYLLAVSSYFYILRLTSSFDETKKKILFFIPFLLVNLIYLLLFIISSENDPYLPKVISVLIYDEVLSLVFLSAIIILSIRIIRSKKRIISSVLLKWLNQFIGIHVLLALVWGGYIFVDYFIFNYQMEIAYYYPLMITFSASLYFISFQVLNLKNQIFDMVGEPKRKSIPIEKKQNEKKFNELAFLMQNEKLYLDNELSLKKLAEYLNINTKVLSYVINENTDKNFNDYVNGWRVNEVKNRLENPAYNHLKILSIALECGFNSKSTFNLAFKKATGLSPSEYQKRYTQL